MSLRILLVFIVYWFLSSFSGIAQNTMGVTLHTDASLEGYSFFSPFSGTKAYLVDNCGQLINSWDRGTFPGLSAYLLDNGLMLRTYKIAPEGPFTSASNAGGLELVDWDNHTVWQYEINTPEWLSHHDAVMMPNGHILVLTWQLVYRDELISLGRDPDEIAPQNFMWSERIIELKPLGSDDAEIIWEWQIKEHYIQDFDPGKTGFGVVKDHPELFDINLPELNSSNSNASRDWNHFNAIDYHPGLDQILISVRNSDEIWILDHSTTSQEASGHSGGLYGKGGDILYRWGNASAYDRATIPEQKLFGQHGVNWIKEGLEDEGKIIIYNNGNGRPGPDFSTVEIIQPPQTTPGNYILNDNEAFGPDTADWVYGDQNEEGFYSAFLSNTQRLSNGNTLINAGSLGTVFEINPFRQKVWEYVVPLFGDQAGTQGQNISNNGVFRVYKFGVDYSGFEGKDLSPGPPIELNPSDCEIQVSIQEAHQFSPQLYYDPLSRRILWDVPFTGNIQLFLFDLAGKKVVQNRIKGSVEEWQIPPVRPGIYVFTIVHNRNRIISAKIFLH